jgi:hypothetical protein
LVKNFSRINWASTAKGILASVNLKKKKKSAKPDQINSPEPIKSLDQSSGIKPAATVSRASEDADIEEWLNKITQKAARETTTKKPVAKSSGSSAAKAKVSVKKAAPKASNARSSKK